MSRRCDFIYTYINWLDLATLVAQKGAADADTDADTDAKMPTPSVTVAFQ